MNVTVVGGGITGLSAAYFLKQRGASVTLLEESVRVGGMVQSRKEKGFLLESGPQSLIDREPAMRDLIGALNLESSVRSASAAAKRRFILTRGAVREVPASPPALLRSDILSWPGKLRLLLEPLSLRGRKDKDETLSSFAQRHFGSEATNVLVDALQRGIYAGDIDKLSARSAFPQMHAWEVNHRSLILGALAARKSTSFKGWGTYTFEGGIGALVDALTQALGGCVRTSTRVTSLVPGEKGFRVVLQSPMGEETNQADQVVLALPAAASSTLLKEFAPVAGRALENIPYAPVSVVQLGFESAQIAGKLEGFGYLVPNQENRSHLGTLFVSSVFPHRASDGHALFAVMVGGATDPQNAALADDALIKLAQAQLSKSLAINGEPTFASVSRWEKAIPQYNVGHADRLSRVDAALARFPGLHMAGNWSSGVGVNDCVRLAAAIAERVAPASAKVSKLS